MAATPLRILLIEDQEDDAELIVRRLERSGYQPSAERVESLADLKAALVRESWDLILSDYNLQEFNAFDALKLVHDHGEDIPFIVVSGALGETAAIDLMKSGAHDYLFKDRLGRLAPVIAREMREAAIRRREREARKASEKLAADLKEALKVRDEFISIASHELKTPLTAMKIQTQLTLRAIERFGLRNLDPGKFNKFLNIVGRQLDRLAHLVDDMLDMSRIESGNLTMKNANTNLNVIAREIVERFSLFNGIERQIQLHEPHGEIVGYWDAYRLEQVLNNLVTNAIKYGENSRIDITIARDSTECARILVRDHGIGIPIEKQNKIFERFERAVPMTNISGLGLGLYITREIINSYGGTIEVESSPGNGALFTIVLPGAQAVLPGAQAEKRASSA